MNALLDPYTILLGHEVTDQLFQIASLLEGIKIVHINSTKEGGGVAEILRKMVPLTNALGIETLWEVIGGNAHYYECTKKFHNFLQGWQPSRRQTLPNKTLLDAFEKTNETEAQRLFHILNDADFVFIHDPQPLPLINHFPNRKGKWVWRCHIDLSQPNREIWKYLKKFIDRYDASIFSLEDFVRPLSHPMYIIPPSIDPLSEKNIELDQEEIESVHKQFHIDCNRPNVLQVSRFDRFKDPLGVILAYRLAKKFYPGLQLILAGGGATDDPEGAEVYQEVVEAVEGDEDIHVLLLPPDAHRTINALQRGANVVVQKSIKEGFGLTVTEALWKQKAVIGGNTGGIRLQIYNHHTGFLVNTPEGAALRIRHLLQNPQMERELGSRGKKLVKDSFLITRNLREYLTLMVSLLSPTEDRVEIKKESRF